MIIIIIELDYCGQNLNVLMMTKIEIGLGHWNAKKLVFKVHVAS